MKPDRGMWAVILLILLAVLAPTGCILYFMNEAIGNQRDMAHRKLADAYRGQLNIVRQRVDALWGVRAAALEAGSDLRSYPSAGALFERLAQSRLADTAIVLGRDGTPLYPALPEPGLATERMEWATGRALQSRIRILNRRGENVIGLIDRFQTEPFASARDAQGRLIAADELLLELRLLPAGDARRLPAAARLHRLVSDYRNTDMPSGQRLFLMEELTGLELGSGTGDFPTLDAERLAAEFLEKGGKAGDSSLRAGPLPNVWTITPPSRNLIAVYRESTVLTHILPVFLQQTLEQMNPSEDVTFGIAPPGPSGTHDAIVANSGGRMPGWTLSMDVKDRVPSGEIARRQRVSYVWVGMMAIATLMVIAIIAGRVFLGQLRVARLKTDLVATVSHELKTPLAGMRLLVDTLLDSPDNNPVQTREYLELISRENARLSRLIDNFLTFSRMERNRAQFDFARTNPDAVVRAAVESIGDRFPIEISKDPALPPILADEDALVTVLLNLLDNAFKYSQEPRHIRLAASNEAGRCCFTVADNGIGIPARARRKIFRRFYQVDHGLTRRPGGVGLGLSIVDFIVKAHGGTVQVQSEPGAGSRFVVSLPALAAGEKGVSV